MQLVLQDISYNLYMMLGKEENMLEMGRRYISYLIYISYIYMANGIGEREEPRGTSYLISRVLDMAGEILTKNAA